MNDMKKSRFNRISPLTKKKRALLEINKVIRAAERKALKAKLSNSGSNQKGGKDD